MASTFTSNLAVEKPANGDDAGTWDTVVNGNMSVFDLSAGTIQAIALGAGSVTLSTAQARSAFLTFTGNLVSNVTVTIPGLSSAPGTTISGKGYTVQNQCGNSSAFTVTLATTVSGQQAICVPPYEPVDILIEGTNSATAGSIKFRNLGRVGTYSDYAGSSVPAWITGCTIPPYLNCDGTTFSSASYPALTVQLGGTTLPDSRGRARVALNQGTGRVTSTYGVDGNTLLAGGGSQFVAIAQSGLPNATLALTGTLLCSPAGTAALAIPTGSVTDVPAGSFGGQSYSVSKYQGISLSGVTTVSMNTGVTQTGTAVMQPSYMGGLTLIRAA